MWLDFPIVPLEMREQLTSWAAAIPDLTEEVQLVR
jgi:hypothetical protein